MAQAIRTMFEAAFVAFCKLNQAQFSAPWNAQRRGC